MLRQHTEGASADERMLAKSFKWIWMCTYEDVCDCLSIDCHVFAKFRPFIIAAGATFSKAC